VSPRRKIEPVEDVPVDERVTERPRRWGLPTVAALAAMLVAGAVTVSTLLLISHESHRRTTIKDVSAVSFVRSFMTEFTSPDPFHANDYAERVLSRATGDFAKLYKEKANEIVVQVARAEPTTGTVLDAAVERWNDNGSADVVVATKISSKSPDGKTVVESGHRWVATAIKEGDQWKISALFPVI